MFRKFEISIILDSLTQVDKRTVVVAHASGVAVWRMLRAWQRGAGFGHGSVAHASGMAAWCVAHASGVAAWRMHASGVAV